MTDLELPEKIFIDPRVAARMPNSAEEASLLLAQGAKDPVAYVSEEYHNTRLREVGNLGREIIIQIQEVGDLLYGLSNHGQLWSHGVLLGHENEKPHWQLIAIRELSP